KNGTTPIQKALTEKRLDILSSYIFSDQQNEISALEKFQAVSLFCKQSDNYRKEIEYLLQIGVTKQSDAASINRLLFGAIKKGDISLAKQLIVHGADVNAQNEYGVTPLMAAAFVNNIDMFTLLLSLNANYEIKSKRDIDTWELIRNLDPKFKNALEMD